MTVGALTVFSGDSGIVKGDDKEFSGAGVGSGVGDCTVI